MTPRDLRRLRRRLGLSQAGFAALVGVAPNTVARWERGELGLRPTSARLIQLIAAEAKPKPRKGRHSVEAPRPRAGVTKRPSKPRLMTRKATPREGGS